MTRSRRSWGQRAVLVLNVALIAVCLGLAGVLHNGFSRAEAINRYELSGSLTPASEDDGGRVINVLLVGADSSSGLDPEDPVQIGREGERNGDVIIVAHLDERNDTAALLSFPRDLWVPIAGTDSEQKINAAFGVGGARTLIETIETAFDLPIHHYVQVDFAGFQGLIEAVGDVPVWFEAPARDWNPTAGITQTGFESGGAGCIELGPEQALAYVRSRYYQVQQPNGRWAIDPRGDFGRIARQQDFLRRLLTRAVDQGARNPFTLRRLIDVALDRVTVDQELTPQDLLDLGRTFNGFHPDDLGTYTVPAVYGTVGTASVLFAEDEALEPVLELFRGAEPDDPATVRVRIVHEGVEAPQVADVREDLAGAGFAVAESAVGEVTPGIAVRYAHGTRAVAAQVAAAVWPDAALVLDPTLPGRDVVVALGGADAPAPADDDGEAPSAEAPGDPGDAEGQQPPDATGAEGPVADPAAACR